MASMNSGIILAGQPVDFASSLGRGIQAAQAQNQVSRQNALADLYQQQGAGIANGDPRALNALAAYDPQAAMQAKATQQGMQEAQQRMDILSEQEKRAAAQYAAGLSKAQREQEATQIETAVKMGMSAQDPQQWNALMGKMAPDLVGQFDQREMLANRYMTLADILKQQIPDMTKGAPSGTMWVDPKNPRAGVTDIPGYTPQPKDDYGRYVQEEQAAGRKPLTRLEFEQAKKGKGFSYTTPDGTTISFGGAADSGGPPKMTEGQGKSAGFYNRALLANDTLNKLDTQGLDLAQKAAGAIPGGLGNYARSPEYQRYDQAKRDLINALLRNESGAVISDKEFANAEQQYFPQPGDSTAVIEQKRRNREAAIEGLKLSSGPGGPYVDQIGGSTTGQADQAGSQPDNQQPQIQLTPEQQQLLDKYR